MHRRARPARRQRQPAVRSGQRQICRRRHVDHSGATMSARLRSALPASLLGLNCRRASTWANAIGLVTTLSQPNLTALSGETADFLAGGEYPDPDSARAWARPRSNTRSSASAWPTRRRCWPMAASRSGSARKCPSFRARARSAQRLPGPGADHPPRRNDGRARLGPELHDRRPDEQQRAEHDQQDAGRRRHADPGLAVPLDQLPARARPNW